MDTSDVNSGSRFEESHNRGRGKGVGPGRASNLYKPFPFPNINNQAKDSCFAYFFLGFFGKLTGITEYIVSLWANEMGVFYVCMYSFHGRLDLGGRREKEKEKEE